jgi:hypothetical protein
MHQIPDADLRSLVTCEGEWGGFYRASFEERDGIEGVRCTKHAIRCAGALSSSPLRTCGIVVCDPCCSVMASRRSEAYELQTSEVIKVWGLRFRVVICRRRSEKPTNCQKHRKRFSAFPTMP